MSIETTTTRRRPRLALTVSGPGVWCDLCGGPFEPGQRAAVYNDAPIVTHDPRDGCPPVPLWKPVIIDGDATKPGPPRLRVGLEVVPDASP